MFRAFSGPTGGPLLEYTWATSSALAEIIRLGQKQGDVAPDLDPTRAGLVISDAFVGVLYRWVSDETFSLQENLMPTLDIVLTGIVREPVVKRARRRPA